MSASWNLGVQCVTNCTFEEKTTVVCYEEFFEEAGCGYLSWSCLSDPCWQQRIFWFHLPGTLELSPSWTSAATTQKLEVLWQIETIHQPHPPRRVLCPRYLMRRNKQDFQIQGWLCSELVKGFCAYISFLSHSPLFVSHSIDFFLQSIVLPTRNSLFCRKHQRRKIKS